MAWKWIGGLDGFPFTFAVLSDDASKYTTSQTGSYTAPVSSLKIRGDDLLTNKTGSTPLEYPLSNNYYISYRNYDLQLSMYIHKDASTKKSFGGGYCGSLEYRYLIGVYNSETKKVFLGDVYKGTWKEDLSIGLYDIPYDWLFGSISDPAIKVDSTDYTLYIDGDRLPNYNLNWNPNGLGEYSEHSQVNIEFRANSINPLNPITTFFYYETIPYTDGFFKFNWSEVWQKLDVKIAIIEEILTNEFTVFIHSSTNVNGENIRPHTSVAVSLLEKKNFNGDLYRDLVSPSDTGDTLTIDFGEGKDTDDYYDTDSGENDEHSPTTGYDIGACNLTTCYELSVERLNNIAIKLWSEDFFSNILLLNNSPIENILSCKLLPLSLSGSESSVKIGNVDMGINGNRLSNTVYRYNIGTIAIPRINNMGFLNYAPYTSITIFLPFIGFKTLNASDIMGRNLSVDYVVDVITGACKAIITVNKYQCYEFDGNCGIDIPLTAGNRSEVEMGYAQAAASAVTSAELGLVGGVIGAHVSGASQQYHYNTTGTYSPATGAYEDRTCFVIIDRPLYTEVSKFGHTKGYKCQLSKTIGSLKGFVKTTENVDLSNISAPEYCKKKILDLLSSGIYV